ncbi:electron transport complex subunit RsxA, partial [candidate division WOR-3 bacterium]|nr:electron transport complex subunit RsxA [candidate division WOR-3 bacterium]
MKSPALIFLAAFLVNNIVLMRFLGLCPFFGVSSTVETATGMGMAVIFVMTLAAWIT